jgi:arsenical pump membrane protein
MSVLFSSIIETIGSTDVAVRAVFATVVGSNIGAFLTPIGALAGIMWTNILNEHELKFGYLDFLKIGITVAIPSLIAALGVIALIV